MNVQVDGWIMDKRTDDKPYQFILLIEAIESTPGLNQDKVRRKDGGSDKWGGVGEVRREKYILYLVPLNNKLNKAFRNS